MEIWKIGGSCLTNAASFRRAAARICGARSLRAVVISAMRGVTDVLSSMNSSDLQEALNLCGQHREVWLDVGGSKDEFAPWAESLLRSLSEGSARPDQFRDQVLSWGDEMSAAILCRALLAAGNEARCIDIGALGLVTNDQHGQAQPVADVLNRIQAGLSRVDGLVVTPGFVGRSGSGCRTTLGRNTSDYTAALIASACHPAKLRVFSAAAGILTSDPELVSDAHHIAELSYSEAAEMVLSGSPVLHPLAIAVMRGAGTEAFLEDLDGSGGQVTVIHSCGKEARDLFRAIPHRSDLSVIEMHPVVGEAGTHLLSECLDAMRQERIHVDMTSASDSALLLAVTTSGSLEPILARFRSRANIVVEGGFSSVSLVGRGVTEMRGVVSKSLAVLAAKNIYPRFINEGGTAPRISFLVEDSDLSEALNTLHDAIIASA